MTTFLNNINNINLLNELLGVYERVMHLKLFVDSDDNQLKNMYYMAADNHNKKLQNNIAHIDAGFDLFATGNESNPIEQDTYGDNLRFFGPGWQDTNPVNKLDLKVCCSARMLTDKGKNFNTGYYMYPRSSLSKTQLRLANSVGIIDAGYRGHLMGMFDVVNIDSNASSHDDTDADYFGKKFDRYLQICAPGLVPIIVEIVNTKEELGEETERGDGGFGSTGR
jgi:dUTPase